MGDTAFFLSNILIRLLETILVLGYLASSVKIMQDLGKIFY